MKNIKYLALIGLEPSSQASKYLDLTAALFMWLWLSSACVLYEPCPQFSQTVKATREFQDAFRGPCDIRPFPFLPLNLYHVAVTKTIGT